MIVDGYNVIYAWGLDDQSLDAARQILLDLLDDYAGYSGENITVVFDGYRKHAPMSEEKHGLLTVIYTAFGVTADTHIQRLVKASVLPQKVVTADYQQQLSVFWSGAMRITPEDLSNMIRFERDKYIAQLHKSTLEGDSLKKKLHIDAISE